ncbi:MULTISPECIES: elongation factor P 5-aminopentanone reductase [Clostridium]|uniref:3-oxoacyl-[acyl-carrier-protein] reductase FabG n=2 Tax=Clostridium TaxID=1485 RepID=A0A151ANL0_9CLOT|nr:MULTISPECIES: SDR family oxidoreductase [Clostridium]KYH29224.1 3-oxoacyl-[acyl-carrier-protein] reductase FabG [Clostridium colicanis DSM 13634]MBE6042920.1 SDR family oxidoreductase [Clostridium thermopalmarium]PRR71061.1 3-oxoacyl-[acyl-carrier-protein] reductase FabG [Clostridium thermopalmarium DSM 5974]PVZ23600.1 3-oxoacyl-[acyl-carrier protein] reductase [Clostridium thermopalmarium DSM 5974]
MNFNGKVILITGGSRGIGKSISKEFAKLGGNVIINYVHNDAAAEKTLEEIRAFGGYAISIKGDISNYNFAKDMVEKVLNKFGKIDVLVNNAGISKVGLFIDMKEEDFDDIINTNLKGVFNTCHNVAKHMICRKQGTIINISSIWGEVGASCEVLYSASKGGINSFTKALGKELASSGVRVNAIQPGVINTEMNKWLTEEERKELESEIPMMRFGEGEDIAKITTFLASEDSKYITSQIITVDGGYL